MMSASAAPAVSNEERRLQKAILWRERISENGVWVALAVLILFNLIATNNFWSLQTVQTNLGQMATVGICAVGMTLIMATGGIDLSVGSLMAVAGAAAGLVVVGDPELLSNPAVGLVVILLTAMITAAVFGFLNGFLVGRLNIQPIVATLVVMIVGRGIAQMVTSGRLYNVENPALLWLGRGTVLGLPVMAWVFIVVVALFAWVARATVFGRRVFAVGGNEAAAELAGVPVTRIKYSVYVIAAMLAGLAAMLSVGVNGTVDTANLGLGIEFAVISAVVVGGTPLTGGRPRILGTVAGVALLQLLAYSLASHNVAKEVSSLIQAAVIIAAVATQLRRRG